MAARVRTWARTGRSGTMVRGVLVGALFWAALALAIWH
jgi:hypothetical protein